LLNFTDVNLFSRSASPKAVPFAAASVTGEDSSSGAPASSAAAAAGRRRHRKPPPPNPRDGADAAAADDDNDNCIAAVISKTGFHAAASDRSRTDYCDDDDYGKILDKRRHFDSERHACNIQTLFL
jgi:hypothetical protein